MNKIILIVMLLVSTVSICYADIDWDRLVPAVIQVESNGNPNAVSPVGCMGLMQINPRYTLKEFNIVNKTNYVKKELLVPQVNTLIGIWYLARLKNHYKCPTIECVLAAYNGGITRLRRNKWDISKMPKETRNYVVKVMKLYEKGV